MPTPLVAIYPKEGTFWHDNPYIILKGELGDRRPAQGGGSVPRLSAAARQPAEPPWPSASALPTPSVRTARALHPGQRRGPRLSPRPPCRCPQPRCWSSVKNAWGVLRKEANIMLVLDVSPSMDDQDKLHQRSGGREDLPRPDARRRPGRLCRIRQRRAPARAD